jgi:hypothetical protein
MSDRQLALFKLGKDKQAQSAQVSDDGSREVVVRSYTRHLAPKQLKKRRAKRKTPAQALEASMQANPEIYEELRSLALRFRRANVDTYGAKALWEYLRQERINQGKSTKGMSNSATAEYARLLERNEPELVGFFRTRGKKA